METTRTKQDLLFSLNSDNEFSDKESYSSDSSKYSQNQN